MTHGELQRVVTAVSDGRPGEQRRELLLIKTVSRIGSAASIGEGAILVKEGERRSFISAKPPIGVNVLCSGIAIYCPPRKQIFKMGVRRDGSIRIHAIYIHEFGH